MSNLGEHLESIRDALRNNYTSLHQLAEELGAKVMIPPYSDEAMLVSSLYDLVKEMETIPSRHAAMVAEDTCPGLRTSACHVLACVRLTHTKIDLKEVLTKDGADDTREDVMSKVMELGETVLPFYEE